MAKSAVIGEWHKVEQSAKFADDYIKLADMMPRAAARAGELELMKRLKHFTAASRDLNKFAYDLSVVEYMNEIRNNHAGFGDTMKDLIAAELCKAPFADLIIQGEWRVQDKPWKYIHRVKTIDNGIFEFDIAVETNNAYQIQCVNLSVKLIGDLIDIDVSPNTFVDPSIPEKHYSEMRRMTFEAVKNTLIVLVILLNTRGIKSEIFEPPNKLNAKRARSKMPLIVPVTIIKIGSYIDASGNEHTYDERKPVRIHWRRGHHRTVHYGKGREHSKRKYIFPCLVNYKPGDEMPAPKEYAVVN